MCTGGGKSAPAPVPTPAPPPPVEEATFKPGDSGTDVATKKKQALGKKKLQVPLVNTSNSGTVSGLGIPST